MNKFPSKGPWRNYESNTRLELVLKVRMNDQYKLRQETKVLWTSWMIQMIFCSWDRGSSLGVVYGEDLVKKL